MVGWKEASPRCTKSSHSGRTRIHFRFPPDFTMFQIYLNFKLRYCRYLDSFHISKNQIIYNHSNRYHYIFQTSKAKAACLSISESVSDEFLDQMVKSRSTRSHFRFSPDFTIISNIFQFQITILQMWGGNEVWGRLSQNNLHRWWQVEPPPA